MPDVRGGLLARKPSRLMQFLQPYLAELSPIGTAEAGERKTGLLGPADIVGAETTRLLHNPDLLRHQLMQQGLLGGGGIGGGSLRHPIGARKLDKPISEMEFTRVPSGSLLPRRPISPEDVQGGYMVPFVGDRSLAATKGTSVGGYPIDTQFHGGGPFMRTPGGVWAAEQPQARAISNTVLRLSETGKPVYATHAVMGPRSIDFQHAMTNQILQVLPQAKISRQAKADFTERFKEGIVEQGKRVTFEDFPGLGSPKLRPWLDAKGQRRTWFAQLMEQDRFRKAGFPNIPEMRVAATQKSQLNLPDFASGAEIARVQPGLLSGGSHPSFPVETPGTYRGGFGTYLPIQTMFPDWYRANVAGSQPGSNWRRSFQMGGVSNAPQELNQQWVDQAMPVWNLLTGR